MPHARGYLSQDMTAWSMTPTPTCTLSTTFKGQPASFGVAAIPHSTHTTPLCADVAGSSMAVSSGSHALQRMA